MTAPDPRAPRRGNGLPGREWGALVDVDPRLSEGLLDRLAAAGIAAYVEPATAADAFTRAVVLPPRPMDRLWVDPGAADEARRVVSREVADLSALLAEVDPGATAHGLVHPVPRTAAARVLAPPVLPGPPAGAAETLAEVPAEPPAPPAAAAPPPAAVPPPVEPAPPTEDELFADLVARFHSDGQERAWPEAEDLPPAPHRRRDDPPPAPVPFRSADPGDPLPGWVEPEPYEDDGHFVPPPPPPVPRVRLRTLLACLSVLLGLLVLFAPALLRLTTTTGTGLLGIALLAGGAGALVWWVRDSADSGPDDGAVV